MIERFSMEIHFSEFAFDFLLLLLVFLLGSLSLHWATILDSDTDLALIFYLEKKGEIFILLFFVLALVRDYISGLVNVNIPRFYRKLSCQTMRSLGGLMSAPSLFFLGFSRWKA